MKFAGGIVPILDRILCVVCSAIIVLFACLLAGQVALRYVWDTPLFWVEELCRFLLVYLTFFGSALAWGRRSHISIDFMLDIVGSRIRRIFLTAVDVLMLGFSGWAIYAGWGYASASMARTSISLGVPTGLAYVCVPVAFTIILVQTLIFLTVRDDQAERAAVEVREV